MQNEVFKICSWDWLFVSFPSVISLLKEKKKEKTFLNSYLTISTHFLNFSEWETVKVFKSFQHHLNFKESHFELDFDEFTFLRITDSLRLEGSLEFYPNVVSLVQRGKPQTFPCSFQIQFPLR